MTISKTPSITLEMNFSKNPSSLIILTKGKSADYGGTNGQVCQYAVKASNVVIRVLNQFMVTENVMIQSYLVNHGMNVTAGMRMVIEFQAVLMSSNAVIFTCSIFRLGSVARIEERTWDCKNSVALMNFQE